MNKRRHTKASVMLFGVTFRSFSSGTAVSASLGSTPIWPTILALRYWK